MSEFTDEDHRARIKLMHMDMYHSLQGIVKIQRLLDEAKIEDAYVAAAMMSSVALSCINRTEPPSDQVI